jgi:hypothetical protein
VIVKIPPRVDDAPGEVEAPVIAAIGIEGMTPEIGQAEIHRFRGPGDARGGGLAEHIGLPRDDTQAAKRHRAVGPVERQVLMEADRTAVAVAVDAVREPEGPGHVQQPGHRAR